MPECISHVSVSVSVSGYKHGNNKSDTPRYDKDKYGRAVCSSVGAFLSRKCSPSALTLNLMFAEYATLSELLGQNK
jgi:hypothetical protein